MDSNAEAFFETSRLVIRKFEVEDIVAFYAYRSNPVIAKYQSWENYQYEQAEEFVRNQLSNTPDVPGSWFQYAIALKENNQLIGDIGVHTLLNEPVMVEFGFTLSHDYQGKGYAVEAVKGLFYYLFGTLNKHKVSAYTDVRNEPSIRLLEKLPMRREGHLLENFLTKGKWVDEYLYGFLKSEWESQRDRNVPVD
ncbi:GNAT family N-acetyltransferase [Bacillus sp. 2205SS5-2]|uniref:GNAT family N-acetyltransferase n=1 Tax=Bacillus sp. 2205SS5-2 TaxID=3109031 RepID=UPI003003F2C6